MIKEVMASMNEYRTHRKPLNDKIQEIANANKGEILFYFNGHPIRDPFKNETGEYIVFDPVNHYGEEKITEVINRYMTT